MKRVRDLLPYIITVLAITLPWFFRSGYLFFTDFVFGPKIILDWQSSSFFVNAVFYSLSFVLPSAFVEKLFVGLVFLVVLLGGRKLIQEILGEQKSGSWLVFILSLFALFNPFVYDRVMYGQFGVVAALGFMAWSLGYLLQYFKSGKLKETILFGVFGGLMVMFSMHFAFFLALFVVLFAINALVKREVDWRKLLGHLALALVIIVVMNLNWLVGLANPNSGLSSFINQGISPQDLIAFQTSGKTNGEVVTNVLMMSGFWGKDQFRYSDLTQFKENWGRSFFILLPIILIGLWVGLRNRKTRLLTIGLAGIFVVAAILAIGIRVPVAREITQFLYNYLPFYKGLREPQKWVSAIVVVYLIFLGLGSKYLSERKIIVDNKFVSGIVLAGILIMQAPLLLWGLSGQVTPVNYPADWQEINAITGMTCGGKILFLPWHMYMSFGWIGHIVGNPANDFFKCPVVTGTDMEWGGIYDNSTSQEGKLVSDGLNSRGNTDLFGNKELGLKYIILAKELDWQGYLWIESLPNLKLIKETRTLQLYQVNG